MFKSSVQYLRSNQREMINFGQRCVKVDELEMKSLVRVASIERWHCFIRSACYEKLLEFVLQ